MDHGSEGFAAEVTNLGDETKNLKGHTCGNCGIIGDHWTKDCRSGRYGRLRKYDRNTIRFKNLRSDTFNRNLKWLFLEFGPVATVAGPECGDFMGDQGLVAFENMEDAQMAIEKLNGSTFKGRVITVGWDYKPDLQINACRHCSKTDSDLIPFQMIGKYVHNAIRVRNCSGEADRSDIASLCGAIGPVFCVFEPGLYYEGTGHLGLLVAFENKEDAVKAVDTLKGSVFKDRVLIVEWPSTKS
ncbi:hypothetical protein MKX03_008589 [Papaver bracteatum]|nr:hypothetical protein MKX03_008589 [Papaver bracteatum]